ncbi:MAG TPA: hypothetical protein VLF67_02470 [Candidatus Saccharimonas sp.]|nr:hypothetical protein [Candidatus Saccharimonas sp.]
MRSRVVVPVLLTERLRRSVACRKRELEACLRPSDYTLVALAVALLFSGGAVILQGGRPVWGLGAYVIWCLVSVATVWLGLWIGVSWRKRRWIRRGIAETIDYVTAQAAPGESLRHRFDT